MSNICIFQTGKLRSSSQIIDGKTYWKERKKYLSKGKAK